MDGWRDVDGRRIRVGIVLTTAGGAAYIGRRSYRWRWRTPEARVIPKASGTPVAEEAR